MTWFIEEERELVVIEHYVELVHVGFIDLFDSEVIDEWRMGSTSGGCSRPEAERARVPRTIRRHRLSFFPHYRS
ncbi:MAG: hypothetical protein ABMB14_16785 [Myxococcota bacterium]